MMRQVLHYALERDLIEANPGLAIERLFAETSRERVLTVDEIRTLWAFLESARVNGGAVLLSGQPEGEQPIPRPCSMLTRSARRAWRSSTASIEMPASES